jgi:hypothetical protein
MSQLLYLVDVKVDLKIDALPVRIDANLVDFRAALRDAAQEVINERLSLLDTRGGRSGSDGFIDENTVSIVLNWDKQS